MSKQKQNKPTNPSPCLHADIHPPDKPRVPEPVVAPPTPIAGTDPVIPAAVFPTSKKRLLIRLEVEAGRVVSQSSHYAED